jgi:hypothetical protein
MDKGEVLRRLERLRVRTRSLDVIEIVDLLTALTIQQRSSKSGKKIGRPLLFDRPMSARVVIARNNGPGYDCPFTNLGRRLS